MNSVCVLVAGMPASGKSRMARELSARLGLPMLSKDDIKELLYDTVGFCSREEKVALGVGAMEAMYYAARQVLGQGSSVILENNFEDASAGRLSCQAGDRYAHWGAGGRLPTLCGPGPVPGTPPRPCGEHLLPRAKGRGDGLSAHYPGAVCVRFYRPGHGPV